MVVQEDVGRLEVEVRHRGSQAVEEVHAHRDLVNHLDLLRPHQRVAGQEAAQRSVAHVLHHHGGGLAARSIDPHHVFTSEFGYFGHLIYYFPAWEKIFETFQTSNQTCFLRVKSTPPVGALGAQRRLEAFQDAFFPPDLELDLEHLAEPGLGNLGPIRLKLIPDEVPELPVESVH